MRLHLLFLFPFILCIILMIIVNVCENWLTFEDKTLYQQPGNVFVCARYLSKACPLAKEFARLLYPNTNITDYTGQDTNKGDILIVVCGCSHAHLFNGVILYGDNGHGILYLPGVFQRKVIYAGVSFPTPNDIVLEHIEIFFPALVATVFSKNSRNNTLLQRQYQNKKRSFLIYHAYYCEDIGKRTFETFVRVASRHGFDIPVETGNCFGSRYNSSNQYDNSFDTLDNDIHVLSNFRFAVVIERKNMTGYVTERILHAFLAGAIPIYSGTIDVFKLFNANSFIYFDTENPQKAIDKIVYLEQHKDAYLSVIDSPVLADEKRTLQEYFSLVDDIGGGTLKRRILHALNRGKVKLMSEPSVNFNVLNYTKINTPFDTFVSNTNVIPFYMYDNKEFYKGNWASSPNCFRDEPTDTALLKIFETHPWRTFIISKAKVFIISIPLIESYKCDYRGHRARVEKGMNTIVSNQSFKRYNGRDHVLMAQAWQMSVWWSKGLEVLSDIWWNKISEVTATRYEYYGMSKWENFSSFESKRRVPKGRFKAQWEPTKRSLIVPYVTPVELNVIIPDYAEWQKRSNFIWYHTTTARSSYDATKLRHLPIHKRNLFPGEIGFDISRSKWITGWSRSKFCLVIRGDTPTSHAFYNALASSCIPVVISDTFDLVGLPFKNLISLKSIAIWFPENLFLHKPETLVPVLRNLSEDYIKTKLFNIKTTQPMFVIRHKKSFLPELVLQETSKIIDNIFNMH